ncbi:Protein of unknown function (DUF3632) domain containing protein [Elaphomyces granulatus]
MAAKSAAELQPLDFSSVKDTIRGDLQSDIFDVLVFLVQSANEDNQNKIIHDAVEKLTKLYLGARPSDRLNGRFNSDLEADSDLEAYDVELFFWTLWGLLLDIVRMMPYNHPKQELLVKFLMTLHRKKAKYQIQIWEDFPILLACLTEDFEAGFSPTMMREIPSSEESSEWLSLNSFAARLKREDLIYGTYFAIYRLRDAVEQENAVREVANCKISVACEWIIRSGIELYREALNGVTQDDEPVIRSGPLYKGQLGLCPERWLFWKSRLSNVSTDEVDEEVVKMAQQAVGEMERVEKVMKKRAMDLSTGEIHHRLSKKSRRTAKRT